MENTIKTNMTYNTTHIAHRKKGVSLIIALIMMTLLLSLSFSISGIILRQLRITNASTNSQLSFYAADSALECTLYWDTTTDGTVSGGSGQEIFGTTTSYSPTTNPIKCGGGSPMGFIKRVESTDPSIEIAKTTFYISYGTKACAQVEVEKTLYRTKISTNGYNVGANAAGTACDTDKAIERRIVERGLVFSH